MNRRHSLIFSLTDGGDEAEVHIDLDPALLPSATGSRRDEHLAARSARNLHELDSIVIPLLWPDCERVQDTSVSVLLGRNSGQLGWLGDDDVLGANPQDGVDVASFERFESAAHDLHVLLRHAYSDSPAALRAASRSI